MQDLEKKVKGEKAGNNIQKEASSSDSYYKPTIDLSAGSYALSLIISGTFISICLEGFYAKVFGGAFIATGFGTLWAGGYSPIKIGKDILEEVGRLSCYPYDYIVKKYKRKEN